MIATNPSEQQPVPDVDVLVEAMEHFPSMSRIAMRKIEQMGGTPCGVLVRNEAGELAAVSDMGRVTWLDDCVVQGDCKGECVLPEQAARAQGDAEPVAWMGRHPARITGIFECEHDAKLSFGFEGCTITPLYIHPPKA